MTFSTCPFVLVQQKTRKKPCLKDGIWGTRQLYVVQALHTRDFAKGSILSYANTSLNRKCACLFLYLKNVLQSSYSSSNSCKAFHVQIAYVCDWHLINLRSLSKWTNTKQFANINPLTAVGKQCGRIAFFTSIGTMVLEQLFPFHGKHLLYSPSRTCLCSRDAIIDTHWWTLFSQQMVAPGLKDYGFH